MFDIDRWHEIFSSIRSNILRTILSGVTVALGLFIFIVLLVLVTDYKIPFRANLTEMLQTLLRYSVRRLPSLMPGCSPIVKLLCGTTIIKKLLIKQSSD